MKIHIKNIWRWLIIRKKYNTYEFFDNCIIGYTEEKESFIFSKEDYELIKNYYLFTDLFFNPNKSINTQARAIAIFKTLYDNNYLKILKNISEFKNYYKENVKLKVKTK